jgi:hypothetical protein
MVTETDFMSARSVTFGTEELPRDFPGCRELDTSQRVQNSRGGNPFCHRAGYGDVELKQASGSVSTVKGGGERMLLCETFIIGIGVVLVVAVICLAARAATAPEEMALLRLARAATAQRGLVASEPSRTEKREPQQPQQPSAA